jgi:hypothetical protein
LTILTYKSAIKRDRENCKKKKKIIKSKRRIPASFRKPGMDHDEVFFFFQVRKKCQKKEAEKRVGTVFHTIINC